MGSSRGSRAGALVEVAEGPGSLVRQANGSWPAGAGGRGRRGVAGPGWPLRALKALGGGQKKAPAHVGSVPGAVVHPEEEGGWVDGVDCTGDLAWSPALACLAGSGGVRSRGECAGARTTPAAGTVADPGTGAAGEARCLDLFQGHFRTYKGDLHGYPRGEGTGSIGTGCHQNATTNCRNAPAPGEPQGRGRRLRRVARALPQCPAGGQPAGVLGPTTAAGCPGCTALACVTATWSGCYAQLGRAETGKCSRRRGEGRFWVSAEELRPTASGCDRRGASQEGGLDGWQGRREGERKDWAQLRRDGETRSREEARYQPAGSGAPCSWGVRQLSRARLVLEHRPDPNHVNLGGD